ncbi:hypothetical protein ACFUIY_18805 [Streptomyces griseorubiginosus]|nr:hypothetical protein [Streptomyces griseorubiginosus]
MKAAVREAAVGIVVAGKLERFAVAAQVHALTVCLVVTLIEAAAGR